SATVTFPSLTLISLFFFFFQAEDGIRDFHVTGVQTCALPIYSTPPTPSRNDGTLYTTAHSPNSALNRPSPFTAFKLSVNTVPISEPSSHMVNFALPSFLLLRMAVRRYPTTTGSAVAFLRFRKPNSDIIKPSQIGT